MLEMIEKHNCCPICKNKKIEEFEKINIKKEQKLFELLKYNQLSSNWSICTNCNHIFLNPCFDKEVDKKLYGEESIYRKYSINEKTDLEYAKTIDYTIGKGIPHKSHYYLIEKIMKFGKLKKGRVLDFGAGFAPAEGAFESLGFHYEGFEKDKWCNDFAKKIGRNKIFSDNSLIKKNSYDLIYTYQVFEHIKNPLPVIRNLKDTLKENGIFFINVPTLEFSILKFRNLNSKGINCLNWGHYHSYTRNSLRYIFDQLNFKIEKIWIGNGDINIIARKKIYVQKKETQYHNKFISWKLRLKILKFILIPICQPLFYTPINIIKKYLILIKSKLIK